MKRLILLIFFLFIQGKQIFSKDSLQTVLKYYPLQDGNYWEYIVWTSQDNSNDTTYLDSISVEVIGDTVMSNNKSYKILYTSSFNNTTFPRFDFERLDSLTANVYRYDPGEPNDERLIDSLLSDVGDTSRAWRYWGTVFGNVCINIYDTLLFYYPTRIKEFFCDDFLSARWYKLARNVGLISERGTDGPTWWGNNLIYAKVGSLEIGNSITSLKEEISPPSKFILFHSYPDPFNSFTNISFYSPIQQQINIDVYDIKGSLIEKLYSGYCDNGINKFRFNAKSLSSGLYFIKLSAKNHIFMDKILYIK